MKIKIDSNANEVVLKLKNIIEKVKQGVEQGEHQTIDTWRKQVIILADEKFFISNGGYISGLQVIEPQINGSVITGSLQNNKAYAVYREYGTGVYSTKGSSNTAWFIHENMIEGGRQRFDQYVNGKTIQIKDTKNGRFYRVEGTKPDAIFQTAFDSTLEVAIDNIITAIQSVLRGM